jgi:hypothetical protein
MIRIPEPWRLQGIYPCSVEGELFPDSRRARMLHFLSVGRYAVKVRPLLVNNIRFRPVNKPCCQHEKISACVPLTTMIEVHETRFVRIWKVGITQLQRPPLI